MKLVYTCPCCGRVCYDHVPGLPKRIQVRRYYCKDCLVEMVVVVENTHVRKELGR